jgi:flagellar assembly factor FliW
MTTPARTNDAGRRSGTRPITTGFGTFVVDAADILSFPQGLPGFESCRHFVLVSSPEIAPLQCLHGVDEAPASFIAIDPRLVVPDYPCALADADRDRIGAAKDAPLVWLALATLDADGRATVNLRAPVVIDPASMAGCQVMPHDSLYSLRHRLPLD